VGKLSLPPKASGPVPVVFHLHDAGLAPTTTRSSIARLIDAVSHWPRLAVSLAVWPRAGAGFRRRMPPGPSRDQLRIPSLTFSQLNRKTHLALHPAERKSKRILTTTETESSSDGFGSVFGVVRRSRHQRRSATPGVGDPMACGRLASGRSGRAHSPSTDAPPDNPSVAGGRTGAHPERSTRDSMPGVPI
jgi:hypothetical protein